MTSVVVPFRPPRSVTDASQAILDGEADRAQVAASLLEELGDALVAIRYAAELVAAGGADPGAMDEPIRVALAACRNAYRDLRAHALEAGVRAALQQLPDRFGGDRLHDGMPGLRVAVEASDPRLDALPPAVAVLVQRVAEAALRGATTHANVRAIRDGNRVKLCVDSAEIAYDASELSRWSRRASALGGDLLLRSDGVELDLPVAFGFLPEGRHDHGSHL